MKKQKNDRRRTALFLLPLLLLLIAGIAEVLFFSSVRPEEPPLEPGQAFRFQTRDVQRIELCLCSNEGVTVKEVSLETPEQISSVVDALNGFRYRKSKFINLMDPQASSETPSLQKNYVAIDLIFTSGKSCGCFPRENGELRLRDIRRRFIGDTSALLSVCHEFLEEGGSQYGTEG